MLAIHRRLPPPPIDSCPKVTDRLPGAQQLETEIRADGAVYAESFFDPKEFIVYELTSTVPNIAKWLVPQIIASNLSVFNGQESTFLRTMTCWGGKCGETRLSANDTRMTSTSFAMQNMITDFSLNSERSCGNASTGHYLPLNIIGAITLACVLALGIVGTSVLIRKLRKRQDAEAVASPQLAQYAFNFPPSPAFSLEILELSTRPQPSLSSTETPQV